MRDVMRTNVSATVLVVCVVGLIALAGTASASVVIRSSVDDGRWTARTAVSPKKGQKITLRVDEVEGATIRWYRILPDLSRNYTNARRQRAGAPVEWAGYDRIGYERIELREFRGAWEIEPFTVISRRGPFERFRNWIRRLSRRFGGPTLTSKEIGSFWFQAEIERDGRVERSPGIEQSDHRGLSPVVFRVSIRDGDGYLGYVSSFTNVPGVFGSVIHQSENYIGVDCADVLVAAYARWKGRSMKTNYSVAMLVDALPNVTEFDVRRGNPNKEIRWETDVRPGDLLAVKYRGSWTYGHIGALHGDANGNGRLDRGDIVVHAGPAPLHYSPLRWGAFNGHVVVLRFKDGFG